MSVAGIADLYLKQAEEKIRTTSTDKSDQEENGTEAATGNRKVKSAFGSVLSTCSALKSAAKPSVQLPDQVRRPFEHSPAARPSRKGYGEALLDGLGAGIKDCVEMVRHPIDTVIEPVCLFAKDVVAFAANIPDSPAGPVAKRRMGERFDAVVKMGEGIAEATGPERAELGTRLAVSMVLASKGINVATGVVKSGKVAATALVQTARRSAKLPEKLPAVPIQARALSSGATTYAKTLEDAVHRVAGATITAEQLPNIANPIHVIPRRAPLAPMPGLQVERYNLLHLTEGQQALSDLNFAFNPETRELFGSCNVFRSIGEGLFAPASESASRGLPSYVHEVGEAMGANRIYLEFKKSLNLKNGMCRNNGFYSDQLPDGIRVVNRNTSPFASKEMRLLEITDYRPQDPITPLLSYPLTVTHVVVKPGSGTSQTLIHHFFSHLKGQEMVLNIPVKKKNRIYQGVLQPEVWRPGQKVVRESFMPEYGVISLSDTRMALNLEEICNLFTRECRKFAEGSYRYDLHKVLLEMEGLGEAETLSGLRQVNYPSASFLIPDSYPVVQGSVLRLFPLPIPPATATLTALLESLSLEDQSALKVLLNAKKDL